jgi:hypothetical protein
MTSARQLAALERLEADPLTLNQLGAIHGEFRRLGYRDPWDRTARLAITAALAWCEPIASTKDLCQGEAGRAIKALRDCATAAELEQLAEDQDQAAAPGPRTWCQLVDAAVAAWLRAGLPPAR